MGKLFSGFSSIDLQIDEVENNDGKESSPQLYFVSESNLRRDYMAVMSVWPS